MTAITVSEILTYPIKSTTGSSVASAELGPKGLSLDRHWALFGADGELLTAREHPDLLRLTTEVTANGLKLFVEGQFEIEVPMDHAGSQTSVDVWGVGGTGVTSTDHVNEWFSRYLGLDCQLIFMSDDSTRLVAPEIAGQSGDVVSYADECPVMLLSRGTLEELNAKLDTPVDIRQFLSLIHI